MHNNLSGKSIKKPAPLDRRGGQPKIHNAGNYQPAKNKTNWTLHILQNEICIFYGLYVVQFSILWYSLVFEFITVFVYHLYKIVLYIVRYRYHRGICRAVLERILQVYRHFFDKETCRAYCCHNRYLQPSQRIGKAKWQQQNKQA